MELMPGYKQSEVGMIPEDWVALPLGEIGSFKNGINKGAEGFGHGSPFINLMDVFGIPKAAETTERLGLINSTPAEQQAYELCAGDVLFVRSSVRREDVGLTTLIPTDLPRTVFSGFLIRFRDRDHLASEFKEHCFLSDGFHRRLIGNSTVSANTNINQEALKSLQLGFPPSREEQRSIANALSKVDALLVSLAQLISKKRNIKQAVMQELLTGKRRLPGFEGEWEVNRLGDFADCTSGGTPATGITAYWGGNIRWMSSGELHLTRVAEVAGRITTSGLENSSARLLPPKCVLVCLAGQGKTRGTSAISLVELSTNQSIAAILPNPSFVPEYLYYCFNSRYDELRELSSGSGGRGGLNLSLIKSLRFPMPTPDEQAAIAAALSDMDCELSYFEGKLSRLRDIKQGMMQQLLTGKIRLT